MNAFHSFLRRSLAELWRKGYGDEVRRAALVAPVLTAAGFASAWFFPVVGENILRFFSASVDLAALSDANGANVATALFLNNVTAAFSALLWGLVPFLYLTALPLGVNFFLLGALGAYSAQAGPGLGFYLLGILPHGIFEIPALVLFCAAGLYLCSNTTARLRGQTEIRLLVVFSDVSRLFLCVILPLLAAAALVEAYVTPRLLSLIS